MTKLKEYEKAKYLLADILPNCGECKYFARISEYKDYYTDCCDLRKMSVEFLREACGDFKPSE